MTQVANKNKNIIQILIAFVFLVVGMLMPTVGSITSQGFTVIGAFVGLIICWAGQIDPWAAFTIVIVFCLNMGINFQMGAFATSQLIGHPGVWIFVVSMFYVFALRECNLIDYLVTKLLGLKIAKRGPYWLMAVLVVTTYVSVAITQASLAVMILLYEVVDQASKKMNLPKYNTWTAITAVWIATTVSIGALAMPFSAYTQMMYAVFTSVGMVNQPNSLVFCAVLLIAWILTTAAIIVITKYIVRPKIDAEAFKNFEYKSDTTKMTTSMKWAIVSMLVLLVVICIPTFCPATWLITQWCNSLGSIGAFLIATMILVFVPKEGGQPGEKIYNFTNKAQASLSLMTTFYLACVMFVGAFVGVGESGIINFLNEITQPLQRMSPFVVISILSVGSIILTNFSINTLPILTFGALGLVIFQGDPTLTAMMIIGVTIGSCVGEALPSSSTMSAVLHGKTEMIRPTQIMGWATAYSLVYGVFLIAALYLLRGVMG